MAENQKHHAHHERVKVSLLEQRIDVLWEEHLSSDFAPQIIGNDAFVADADPGKLKDPGRYQAGNYENQKEAVNEPYLE